MNIETEAKDLKTVLITGANSGLGFETAKYIAHHRKDYYVLMVCRNKDKAEAAIQEIQTKNCHSKNQTFNIGYMLCDLCSFASVRKFAQELKERLQNKEIPPLRSIVCNAALQFLTSTTRTVDGFESTFQIAHLSHFLLVNLLITSLSRPSRIVFVSSGTHDPSQFTGMPAPNYESVDALAKPPETVNGQLCYTNSKLCNMLCAYEFVRRLEAGNINNDSLPLISVTAFDPGLMPGTGLARDYNGFMQFMWHNVLPVLTVLNSNVNTPTKSGLNLANLASAPEYEGVTNKYFIGNKSANSSVASHDKNKAAELWVGSVQLTQLQPHETPLNLH